ncbi:ABC transporter permease [Ruminiclostridium cellobioparum]|uniref:ABC transporter permease n=1 Tax=Ruminiclostridium cellobioparum TaxID=29355 RepID=UPI0005564022|nr:ABC transporter permease subunit [Ruminiclostridium cellobioparum]
MSSENVTVRKRKRGFFSEIRTNGALFLMLVPGAIVLLINNYLPMFGVVIAFKRYRLFNNFFDSVIRSEFVGFDNFAFFFKSPYAFNITRNTILYNLVFIALDLIVPVALAIALNELRNKRGSKTYQSLMFLPYFLSWIVVSYLAYSFLSMDKGFINTTFLSMFGLDPVNWYSETKAWPFILTFFHMWKYTGYNIVVYIASIAGIDSEYFEAASLDGASKWQQIRHITLPLLQPIMIIMTLLAVGRIFNADFGLFYNVTKNSGSIASVTDVIDTYVYKALRNSNNMGMTAAAGLYQAVVGCITVFTANMVVRKIDKDKALF